MTKEYKTKETIDDRGISLNLESKDETALDGSLRIANFRLQVSRSDFNGIYCQFDIISSPTSNCQIYSIGNSGNLFSYSFSKKERLFILKYIQSIIDKNQLLIDVERTKIDRVEETFKGFIVFRQDYDNTKYGTPMSMFLLKTDPIK